MNTPDMFQRRAPAIELYDINQLAPQFQGVNFGLGAPYDGLTPQIALMTINEIQGHAQKGHPIRVGMFNFISQNGFQNPSFNDLLYTIMMRVGHGITNQEFRNMDIAVNTTVVKCVKSCGCAMAAEDPEFLSTLNAAEVKAVHENTKVWDYLLALAQGNVTFIPFSQMETANSITSVNTATNEAIQSARALRGNTAGAFSENGSYDGISNSQYNNNGGQNTGRYGRRAETIMGKVQGSMQTALKGAAEAVPYQGRIKRPEIQKSPVADVAKFDSDITDFSKPMDTPVVAEPAVEAKPLFTIKIENRSEGVV